MKLKRRLAAIATATMVATGVVLAAPVATPTPTAVAQAGECTAAWAGLCGRVKNTGSVPIRLVQGWPTTYGIHLPAGRVSSSWYADTDGVYAYRGQRIQICMPGLCRTITGPAAFKVQDSFWTYTARVL